MSYAQTRKDFEYLEKIIFLDDAVEIDARVFELMETPTKKKAASLYLCGIQQWFHERYQDGYHSTDEKLHRIAARYGQKLSRVGITK